VKIFKPQTPLWSSWEYSSTPSILSIETEVSYPWEITLANFMTDVQVQRMAKTKSTLMMRSPDELLAEGTVEGNLRSVLSSSGLAAKVVSANTSSSLDGTSSRSSDMPSRRSSSEGTSTSSSLRDGLATPDRLYLRRGAVPLGSRTQR